MFANTSMKSKHVTRNKGLVARLIAAARLRKGKTAHNAQPDNSLLDTLFAEAGRRSRRSPFYTPRETAKVLSEFDALRRGFVYVFANQSHQTHNLKIWLEDTFGAKVIFVYECAIFHEWLQSAKCDASMIFVDEDSFEGDAPSFSRFMTSLHRECEDKPLVVLSRDATLNEFSDDDEKIWDVTLKSPLSKTALWLGINVALDFAKRRQ